MSLTKQSLKAQKLNPVICLFNGCNHKHVTACRSDRDPSINYEQIIQPIGKEVIDGHKAIVYKITCFQVGAPDMLPCQGNGHTYHLCKHSLAGVRAVVARQGKKLYTSAKLENALKRPGTLVKLVGESGFVWGVVQNGR